LKRKEEALLATAELERRALEKEVERLKEASMKLLTSNINITFRPEAAKIHVKRLETKVKRRGMVFLKTCKTIYRGYV
jgi:hypothetical protein